MLAILLGLLWFSPPSIDVALPRPSELSAVANDPVELERLAARLGGARLLQLWEGSVARGQSKAAAVVMRSLGLTAAQHPERACQLLPVFLDAVLPQHRSRRLDEGMTRSVADTLQRIGDGIGQAHFEGDFAGPPLSVDLTSELADLARRLLGVAYEAGLPPSWREAALLSLTALPTSVWAPLAPQLARLAQVSDAAALQRPALTALAVLAQHERSTTLMDIALQHSDPSVASMAAGEFCLLASPPPRRPATSPSVTGLLPPALAARVRALAALDFPPAGRQRLGECLRLLATPQDRLLWQAIQAAAKRPRR